eukprot:UN3955
MQELQRRAKGSSGLAASSAAASPSSSFGGSFTRLAGDERRQTSSGAELQPVTARDMMLKQKEKMKNMDEHLVHLEGSVNNLQQVSSMVLGEVRSQNSMLDSLNEDADRVQGRLGRARSLLTRVAQGDRSRWLLCSVFGLLVALIVLFVYAVGT